MNHPQPTISDTVARVRAWLIVQERGRRAQIAAEAGVDEKTLRLAAHPSWNPTASTLQKLETIIPPGWHAGDPLPPKAGAGGCEAA